MKKFLNKIFASVEVRPLKFYMIFYIISIGDSKNFQRPFGSIEGVSEAFENRKLTENGKWISP